MKISRWPALYALLTTLSVPLMAKADCHYIMDCEMMFRRSKELADLKAAGKTVVLVQSYRINDTVVTGSESFIQKEVLFQGSAEAEVVVVTLSGFVNAGGYISENRLYTQNISAAEFKQQEDAHKLKLAEKEKERQKREAERKSQEEELNRKYQASKSKEQKIAEKKAWKLKLAQGKLTQLQQKVDQHLIFGLPSDDMVLFLIDGSGSVRSGIPRTGSTYLAFAIRQMEAILPLLSSDQYFSVGFFNEGGPALFNHGKPLLATEKNVFRALQFLQTASERLRGSSESFHTALEQAINQRLFMPEGKFDSIYIFSDFEWTSDDLNISRGLIESEESKVYFSLFGKAIEKNARFLSEEGKVLRGDRNGSFSREEAALIRQQLAELRKEIKKNSPAQ